MTKRRTFYIVCAVLTLVLALGSVTALGGLIGGLLDATFTEDPITAAEYLDGYSLNSSTDFSNLDEEAWHLGPKTMHTMDVSSDCLIVRCTGYESGKDAMFYSATNKEGFGSRTAFDFDIKRTATQPLISRFNIKVANSDGDMVDVAIARIKADGSVKLASVDENGNGIETTVMKLSPYSFRHVTCGIDLESKTVDFFVDGKLVAEDAPINVPDGYTEVVRLFYLYVAPTRSNAENNATIILDNVKVFTAQD